MPKVPFYVPYGYNEEQDYDSKQGRIEQLLDASEKNDVQEFADIESLSGAVTTGLFASAAYDKDSNSIRFYNVKNDAIGTVSMSDISVSGLIESAVYDKDLKQIIITFDNGDVIRIDVSDMIDIDEAGDGLESADGKIKVKIDESSEAYISVSEDGVKIAGVDAAIADAISGETERAEAAEAALDSKIDAETDRAISAETTLNQLISAETTRAIAQETALATNLANETSRAQGAEGELQRDLTAEVNRAIAKETELNDKIEAETARAEAAEEALATAVSEERERAISAETALDAKIDAEVTRAEAAEAALQTAIEEEEARATSAETALDTKIEAETTRAEAAEAAIDTKVDDEIARATSAETALDDKIDAETTRAEAAESGLQTLIEAEETRATSAETALDAKIDAETARATSAETALDEKIDTIVNGLDYSDSAVTGKYVSEVDEENGVISVSRLNVSDAPLNGFTSEFDNVAYAAATADEVNKITSGDTINQAFNKVEKIIIANELAIAAAENDLNQQIADEVDRATTAESGITSYVNTNAIMDAQYVSVDKEIIFKNSNGNTVATIDASDFIKDGMVSNVEIKDVVISGESVTCLVITFNTESGKEDINIPISDIFDASNYYTKTETDGVVATAINALDFTDTEVDSKYVATVSETDGIVSVSRKNVSEAKLNNFNSVFNDPQYTAATADVQNKIVSGDTINQAFNKIERIIIDNEEVLSASDNYLNGKITDEEARAISAETVLSGAISTVDGKFANYYTTAQTSSSTQISDAFNNCISSAQVNTLISNAVNDLDFTDTAVSGKYVSEVDEVNGVISVQRENVSEAPLLGYDELSVSGTSITSLDSIISAIKKIIGIIESNERVISTSLNDLNTRVTALENA